MTSQRHLANNRPAHGNFPVKSVGNIACDTFCDEDRGTCAKRKSLKPSENTLQQYLKCTFVIVGEYLLSHLLE